MNGLHFDRVVKSLVARGPRRSLLGAVTGVALTTIAALRTPHRALAAGGSCTAEAAAACTARGFSCCNNQCVCATCDQNCPPGVGCLCGSCPNICAPCSACVDLEHGGSCYIGDVEDPCAGNCRPGLSHCRGHCVDLNTDLGYCGTCDTVCLHGCVNGVCTGPPGTFPNCGTLVACDGVCCDHGESCCHGVCDPD
jgi:hypothetical protein